MKPAIAHVGTRRVGRRFWPELLLLAGAALVVASVLLGHRVDDRQVLVGRTHAAIVVATAVAAVLCFAAFLTGRLAMIMSGRRGEGLVVLVSATAVALASIPISLFVGWAIRLSLTSTAP
ncbi:hypothetical protein [Aeromicrobium endophyticum]|uniref:Uncharacterized protein n=1 Tax=Aeromicrobium endophyticum TaxID=2292704 RepID=A0A371P2R4_9ACTN|nr:hypothetical protein [Aeromicrobium endophyticum]REK69840.1 hypothetical protein DX116_11645 [Aeromicrobium endophyticum]